MGVAIRFQEVDLGCKKRLEANVELVKAATLGLVGDRVEMITFQDLQARVADQADRIGAYAPSYAAIVEACWDCDFLRLGRDQAGRNAFVQFVYAREGF